MTVAQRRDEILRSIALTGCYEPPDSDTMAKLLARGQTRSVGAREERAAILAEIHRRTPLPPFQTDEQAVAARVLDSLAEWLEGR